MLPVVLGLFVNVGAHFAVVTLTVFNVVAVRDMMLNPLALPTPLQLWKERYFSCAVSKKKPVPNSGPTLPSLLL